MAGKQIISKAPVTIEELKAKVQARYAGVRFEHPSGYGVFELAVLKRAEREEIVTACTGPGGVWDNMLQNRMAVSFGLVAPKISADDLREYPDDFIDPLAIEVWRMTNAHADTKKEQGDGIHPFFVKSSSVSDLLTPSDKPSSPSTPSATTT